jgi:hypothetical protein
MQAKIDGKFVEVTWQDGNDEKTLLITPQDIVKNYHAAQQNAHSDGANESANLLPLLEECLENGKAGEAQLYSWFLGEVDVIEQAIEDASDTAPQVA